NVDVVRALVQHGAKVNSVDNDRRTAVQSASWQGHETVVKLLLEAGARVDHTCNQGATALRSNSSTSSGDIKMNTPMSTTQGTTAGSSSIGMQGIEVTNVMIQPSSASPESSSDRRKSYHSNNSSSKSSIITTSTNQSSQSGFGNLSRLDRECLTFTQQLQQCSMGKNRSRPISRVLSPVSEPQSPLHSPCRTPVVHSPSALGSTDQNNINILAPSPIKHGSSKQERISATINIITNPHADMMSSVEEPVWQRNPAHPANSHHFASTTNSSSSSKSPSRIIMGRVSLESKSPDTRRKRNGIVTNPKVLKPGSVTGAPRYNHLSQDLDTQLASHSPTTNGFSNILPPGSHEDIILKPVRPSGLPIKKINSPQ
ncbi:unnamed protein product, partial [Lymnaea stagnalis]